MSHEVEPELRYDYDHTAGALYVYLSDKPYANGKDLDAERRVDDASDGTPRGVELPCVSAGVILDDLPEADRIEALVRRLELPVFA